MSSRTSHSLINTLSFLFIFLSLPSSLTLGGVHALGTSHPGGELLPRLAPHAPRNNPLLRRSDTTWLSAPMKSTKGGKVAPGFSVRGTGLAIRAPTCQDDGYSICPSKIVCCPTDGLCCDSGDCCNKGFRCCAQGDCCPESSNCVEIDGVRGCCPVGKTCSLNNDTCADEGYVPCKNDSFCCKPGETCSRGPNGQAVCDSPPPTEASSTTLTTFKSTRVVGGATSSTAATTTSQAQGNNGDPSNTKSDQPANQSSRTSQPGTAYSTFSQKSIPDSTNDSAAQGAANSQSTVATVSANSLPTTMSRPLVSSQSGASSASSTSANTGSDFNPNPSNNSSGRSYQAHGSMLILGLVALVYVL